MGPGMKKGFVFLSSIFLLVGLGLMFCWGPIISSPQESDPFYVGLLQKGEQSYLSGNYSNAIRQLKTSIFGLHADKTLQAKALIYLSLANYYMKESTQSRDYITQALDFMGADGFATIELDDRARQEITGLLVRFKLAEFSPPPQEQKIVSKPEPNTNSSDNPDGAIPNYYELHKLNIQKGNRREARKTLQKLVEAYPDEIYGFYLLGLMCYQDRKFKDAEQHFQEALRPRPNLMLSDDLIEELKAYQIISVYQRGDKNRALDIMSVSVYIFTEAKIRQLPLSGTDKSILREVIREYMKRQ